MPPYFFPYSQTQIEHFYREFARETGDAVPLMLYNIPQFSSRIEPDTAARLFDSGRFAGIKDSSGEWNNFEQLLALKRTHPFALLAGHDRIALQALRAGADGILSGCASAVPELLVALYNANAQGDQTRAERLNSRLSEFVDRIERFPAPVAIKRAVEIRGQKAGEPSVPLSAEHAAALEEFPPGSRHRSRRG